MTKISLKGIWAHKRRLVGTLVAVFLGVAFLSGTLALGDTLRANFDQLFTEANAGTDALIRHQSELSTDPGEPDSQRGLIPQSLVDDVRSVEGVAAAAPVVEGFGEIEAKDGDGLGGDGPPTLAGNWVRDAQLNPYEIAEGRAPRAPGEVVINVKAAEDGDLRVGDSTVVRTPEPVPVQVVGLARFGDEDGLGGVTFAAFTLEQAQERFGRPGEVSSIAVRADAGVSQDALVQRLESVLPDNVQAITGSELTTENIDDINSEFLDMLRTFLVVFAGVALLVGTFSIYNTFSIIVAQRTRESALMRALGAGRGQVLGAVVLEAVIVGAVASLAGIVGGLGIASLLKAMFDAFGFALPAGGLEFTTNTIAVALVVGMVVTLVAAAAPAVRASRVAPLAALRDVSVDRTGSSVVRAIVGLALTAGGVAIVLTAVFGDGDNVLPFAGLGALLTIIGMVVFGPVVARPVAGAIGSPLSGTRGVVGSLARRNATRNPRRTAGTASALMIGVGVVTLFTVFAASLKASIDQSVSQSFRGDLVVSAGQFGSGGLSPDLATDAAELPEVQTAVGLGRGTALVGDDTEDLTVADTTRLDAVLDLDLQSGSIDGLDDRSLAVSESMAEDRGWRIGSTVAVTFADGTEAQFRVGAIFGASDVMDDVLLPRSAWAPHSVQDIDSTVLIELAPNVSMASGTAAVEQVAERFGNPDVQDRQAYVDSVTEGVNMMLGLVYVMLALAIVIALMGIANTLSLSIHERTRELGLLRAVGETRRQLRSMIRWESVIIAVFGTLGGLGLGVFLGWGLVQAASTGELAVEVFEAPTAQLTIVLVVGAIAGVLAGLRPARRAARLDVLQAIATD
jgi:putative ABC transport system permease protein